VERPTSLSAPSCKAGMYARCRFKTIETGDDRLPAPSAVGDERATSLGITLLFCTRWRHSPILSSALTSRFVL